MDFVGSDKYYFLKNNSIVLNYKYAIVTSTLNSSDILTNVNEELHGRALDIEDANLGILTFKDVFNGEKNSLQIVHTNLHNDYYDVVNKLTKTDFENTVVSLGLKNNNDTWQKLNVLSETYELDDEEKYVSLLESNISTLSPNSYYDLKKTIDLSSLATNDDKDDLIYDKIELYLGNNWNAYESIGKKYDGILISAFIRATDGQRIYLLRNVIKNEDIDSLNQLADNKIIGEHQYNKCIQLRILSTAYLNDTYNNKNSFAKALIDSSISKSLPDNPQINIEILGITSAVTDNTENTFYYNPIKIDDTLVIPNRNDIVDLFVDVAEDEDGADYFKAQLRANDNAAMNEVYLNSYIQYLINSTNNHYSLYYDVEIVEHYMSDTDGDNVNELITKTSSKFSILVDDDIEFDMTEDQIERINNPVKFRPVIEKAASCITFDIKIKARIVNNYNKLEIITEGFSVCKYPHKYGKRMVKINLGQQPVTCNVYNKREDKDKEGINLNVQSNVIQVNNLNNSSNEAIPIFTIGSFLDATNVCISTVDLQSTTE